VLGYVGFGEYFYVAGVCRRWRGRYISFCHAEAPAAEKHKLRTLREAVVSTAARLQLALINGLKMTVLDIRGLRSSIVSLAYNVLKRSLEPIALLTLLRVYGYQWDSDLYVAAAEEGNLELIKWLHQVQCPSPPPGMIAYKCCQCMSSTAVSVLHWLHSVQPEWFNEVSAGDANKTSLLYNAGEHSNFVLMQWLRRELKAEWPNVAEIICDDEGHIFIPDWPVETVIWALDSGLNYTFDCSMLNPEEQPDAFKSEAIVLWQWLHKESNRHRCTCSNAVA
jgi:hypothetical protein